MPRSSLLPRADARARAALPGRPRLAIVSFVSSMLLLVSGVLRAQTVSTTAELLSAFEAAGPGTTITLRDGTYSLAGRLVTPTAGTEASRITLRAQSPGGAIIATNGAEEAFQIVQPYWSFLDLHVRVTGAGSFHAYKLEGNGQHAVIRGGKMELFPGAESGIKAAGGPTAPQPDFGLIEGTEIWFTSPTTYFLAEGIDAVAVAGWVIRNNVIHDIRTSQSSVAYGAFTKGNSRDTIIENNLVYDCFIGLSLGGGGTGAQFVRDGDTSFEDRNGIIRNNIVLNSDDVALYLYSATNSRVYNNTFYNSFTTCGTGCSSIDVRLASSSADVRNNILDKRINDREGGRHTEGSNLILSSPSDPSWFIDAANRNLRLRPGTPPVDQGETLALVPTDFFGAARPSGRAYDIGAHELGGGSPPMDDAGTTGPVEDSGGPDDGGISTADAKAESKDRAEMLGSDRTRGTSGGCGCSAGRSLAPPARGNALIGLGLLASVAGWIGSRSRRSAAPRARRVAADPTRGAGAERRMGVETGRVR